LEKEDVKPQGDFGDNLETSMGKKKTLKNFKKYVLRDSVKSFLKS
jgi:hypothetical protein